MDKLEVIARGGNLSVSLPQERGNNRIIIVNPEFQTARPQLQFLRESEILKVVNNQNYQKDDDGNWAPSNLAYQTYQPESLEYRAFEMVTKEARAIFNKFQAKYNF